MPKYFVLDTNVLLHNSNAVTAFADNVVVLPMTVIEELDRFKSSVDKKGMHARQVLREIDRGDRLLSQWWRASRGDDNVFLFDASCFAINSASKRDLLNVPYDCHTL